MWKYFYENKWERSILSSCLRKKRGSLVINALDIEWNFTIFLGNYIQMGVWPGPSNYGPISLELYTHIFQLPKADLFTQPHSHQAALTLILIALMSMVFLITASCSFRITILPYMYMICSINFQLNVIYYPGQYSRYRT